MSNIIVQKFGGTSVASPKRIEAVAKIVGQEIDSGNHVAVVVSAMACLLYTSPSPRDA